MVVSAVMKNMSAPGHDADGIIAGPLDKARNDTKLIDPLDRPNPRPETITLPTAQMSIWDLVWLAE